MRDLDELGSRRWPALRDGRAVALLVALLLLGPVLIVSGPASAVSTRERSDDEAGPSVGYGFPVFTGATELSEVAGSSRQRVLVTRLGWTSSGTDSLGDVDLIDVLPALGDGGGHTARHPASAFHGRLRLSSITPLGNGTLRYTGAAAVDPDPAATSNGTGGATRWCLRSELGTAGCPANLGSVTAIRYGEPGLLAPGQSRALDVRLVATGSAVKDRYSNSFGARAGGVSAAFVSNTASLVASGPAVSLVQYVNGVEATKAPGVRVDEGSRLRLRYVVRNTGTVPLRRVTLTDAGLADGRIDCGSGSHLVRGPLAPGRSVVCIAKATARAGSHRYAGRVDAVAARNLLGIRNVTDRARGHYTGRSRPMPAIIRPAVVTPQYRVTTETLPAASVALVAGDKVVRTIRIANTGKVRIRPTVTVHLASLLNGATYNGDAVASLGGRPVLDRGVLTWSGQVAPGASAVLTFSATVEAP
jgi:hypothetical protein